MSLPRLYRVGVDQGRAIIALDVIGSTLSHPTLLSSLINSGESFMLLETLRFLYLNVRKVSLVAICAVV